MHIRAGDIVEVLTGVDRGTRAKVVSIDHKHGKAVVEGVARVFKHVRRTQKNPQGGRLSKEMPIDLSNVALVCESCGKAARTGVRAESDGSKFRYCKKCGKSVGQISPPRAARATSK